MLLLPVGIKNYEEYCTLVCDFLCAYHWLYDFKGIDIVESLSQTLPTEFISEFNALLTEDYSAIVDHSFQGVNAPKLSEFVASCKALTIDESLFVWDWDTGKTSELEKNRPKKWTDKKFKEVLPLASFLELNAETRKFDTILDIGSGLGYLCSILAEKCPRLSIIAVEGNNDRVKSSAKINAKKHSPQKSKLFHQVEITLDSHMAFQLNEAIPEESQKICLTGLHSCGDLTPWTIKTFLSDPKYDFLAIVSCCYHKMDSDGILFPLSLCLDSVMKKKAMSDIEKLKGLQLRRLGSQRMGKNFLSDIEKETRSMFYRSLLEFYVKRESLQLHRKKRKLGLSQTPFSSFSNYIECMIGSNSFFELVGKSASYVVHYENLMQLHEEMKEWEKSVTCILAMQGAIQQIVEQFILMDRLHFLLESPVVEEARLVRIIPESVSPRGIVIMASKK